MNAKKAKRLRRVARQICNPDQPTAYRAAPPRPLGSPVGTQTLVGGSERHVTQKLKRRVSEGNDVALIERLTQKFASADR